MKNIPDQKDEDNSQYYEPYSSYSNNLRTWLVAFGVGGPALIVTNDSILKAMKCSGSIFTVAILFFVGVIFQIIISFINKIMMWYVYAGYSDENFKMKWQYIYSDKWSKYLWPDIVCDIVTIVCFSCASILIFCSAVANVK